MMIMALHLHAFKKNGNSWTDSFNAVYCKKCLVKFTVKKLTTVVANNSTWTTAMVFHVVQVAMYILQLNSRPIFH